MVAPEYVPALGQSYTYDPESRVLTFEDGVEYTLREAIEISRGLRVTDSEAVRVLHSIKKHFDGEILGPQWEPCMLCGGKGTRYSRQLHKRVECPICKGQGGGYL